MKKDLKKIGIEPGYPLLPTCSADHSATSIENFEIIILIILEPIRSLFALIDGKEWRW